MNDQIKQRRERLIWAIVAIIIFFVLGNKLGIIETGHFERDPVQQQRELSEKQKEFWDEWHKTFGGEAP